MKAGDRYPTEAALCADFIAEVRVTGKWEAYPECEGWDVLLVRLADGFQIGVEAKLKFNAHVVAQAIEGKWSAAYPGPDCRAVLVPVADGHLVEICSYIGITIIELCPVPERNVRHNRISPSLPLEAKRWSLADGWFELAPACRHRLPDYVPDCVAGASAPIQLTRWKIAAMKIAIILETRPVTRADFKALEIDYRRWLPSGQGWLSMSADRTGWVAGPRLPDFKAQHPRNWEEIKADAEKWMPSSMPSTAHRLPQGALL